MMKKVLTWDHFSWIRFLVWNILFSFEQSKIYRIEEKHVFLDENCDLEQETDSEHTNVLLEMLFLDKFNRFCVSKVSGVKYFLFLTLSENTHDVMKSTHFCLRIVVCNKKWGQSNLMCCQKWLFWANSTICVWIRFLVLNVIFV